MINRVIRILVTSDLFLNFAFGLLSPIFAVFILHNIQGSSLRVIGLATAFYWIARTLSTVPLSRLMDKTDGERDEFYFVVAGSFIMSTLPLFFLAANQPWHIYVIELVLGLSNSMAVPAWRILFTGHLDKGRVGFEWSLEDIAIGVSIATSAYVGSVIADHFGFQAVFICLTILGYVGSSLLLFLNRNAKTLAQMRREGRTRAFNVKSAPFKIDTIK